VQRTDRKAALTAYRERKIAAGIFAIRCEALDLRWVGKAPDLSTIWNRMAFTLRRGAHPRRDLQEAWTAQGGNGFVFEELERLDDDTPAMSRDRILKARLAHWTAELRAARL
jgi:hypothetical protein